MSLIAVMMALSLPMLSHANAEARSVVCRQNLAEIGGAVNGYLRDYGMLPRIAELPPHEPGMSLPELVGPRLQTPNVTFCPSDETERSQLLSTSYNWATAYNGLKVNGLDRAVDQTLLDDRESFHLGADIATNELVLRRENGRYQFYVTGTTEEDEEKAEDEAQNSFDPDEWRDNNAGGNPGGNGKRKNNTPNPNANPNAWRNRD